MPGVTTPRGLRDIIAPQNTYATHIQKQMEAQIQNITPRHFPRLLGNRDAPEYANVKTDSYATSGEPAQESKSSSSSALGEFFGVNLQSKQKNCLGGLASLAAMQPAVVLMLVMVAL